MSGHSSYRDSVDSKKYIKEDLRKKDLPQDLRGENFTRANLCNVDLSRKDLRGADFTDANLRNVNFSRAKIQGANFFLAKLGGADFRNALNDFDPSLPVANFSQSKIQGTNFTSVDLNHVDFTGSTSGLNRYWLIFLLCIHILLCFSAFTTTISISFLIFFFRTKNKEISWVESIFIWITSITWIIYSRIVVFNFNRGFATTSVFVGIVAISIVLAITIVNEAIAEKGFNDTMKTAVLLLLVLLIFMNAGLLTNFEDSLVNEQTRYFIRGFGKTSSTNVQGTDGVIIAGSIATMIGGYFGCWFSRSAINKNVQFNWLWEIYIHIATHGGTLFNDATLHDAIFNSAKIKGANFKKAKIHRAIWEGVEFIEHARTRNTYLAISKIRSLILDRKLENREDKGISNDENINFSGLNLEGINLNGIVLSKAKFIGTILKSATLQGCDLTDVDLQEANLKNTNLSNAILTHACIQDCIVDETTNFSGVKCEYVVEKSRNANGDIQKHFPVSPDSFKPGDFENFFAKDNLAIKLLIRSTDNLEDLTVAFQKLVEKNHCELQGFNVIGDSTLIEIKPIETINKGSIESEFYQELHKPNGKSHDRLLPTTVMIAVLNITNNMSRKTILTGNKARYTEGDYIEGDKNITESDKNIINMSQDLVEASSKINDLFRQLKENGDTDDLAQTKLATAIATEANSNQEAKRKLSQWGVLENATINELGKTVSGTVIRLALKLMGL
jgi:uncharacterized protein YjbI with pentapeptide repeats